MKVLLKIRQYLKASPFHKLTQEQINAKEEILNKIKESIILDEEGQLLIVEGEAGSGKTVLMSTLLYELKKYNLNLDKDLDIHLLVNHNEHVTIYNQIATKLGITNKRKILLINLLVLSIVIHQMKK